MAAVIDSLDPPQRLGLTLLSVAFKVLAVLVGIGAIVLWVTTTERPQGFAVAVIGGGAVSAALVFSVSMAIDLAIEVADNIWIIATKSSEEDSP